MNNKKSFYTANLPAKKRVGPHNQDVISVLVGNLLGDGYAEKRENTTRFHLRITNNNAQYVFWLYNFFAERGYCSPTVPSIKKQIGNLNRVHFSIKFTTFSFNSLNYLHENFYPEGEGVKKKRKCVPTLVKNLLTERALAVWIMDKSGKSGDGLKLSTEGFTLQDNRVLQKALSEKFFLEPFIQRHTGHHLLYFKKIDYGLLSSLVKPYTHPCMYYKLKQQN